MNTKFNKSVFFTAALILFFSLIIFSVLIQDYTGYIPACLFNRHQSIYYILSILTIVVSLCAIILLWFGKSNRYKYHFTLLILMVVSCEIIVRLFSWFLIDGPKGVIGEFYNNGNVILRRPTMSNRLGFNESYNYTKAIPRNKKRIIFLGDSYTMGSGSSKDNSYCEVVESYLSKNSSVVYEVFNAGVSGYSPYDSYKMLKFLKANDYLYDAVVFSLFVQNDFIDEIANSYRSVMAGYIQRFPNNIILRYMHPLNTYLFRFGATAYTLFRGNLQGEHIKTKENSHQIQNERNVYIVNPITLLRVNQNYIKGAEYDYKRVYSSISGLARESGKPFY